MFLLGITGVPLDRVSDKVAFTSAYTIEQIYYLYHHNILLPRSFTSNLFQFYTGFKTLLVINGKLSTSRNYPAVINWMEGRGKEELNVPRETSKHILRMPVDII